MACVDKTRHIEEKTPLAKIVLPWNPGAPATAAWIKHPHIPPLFRTITPKPPIRQASYKLGLLDTARKIRKRDRMLRWA